MSAQGRQGSSTAGPPPADGPAGFGERLRSARVAGGYTQRGLAAACDLSASYLSLLEAGLRPPTVQVATVLAGRLGLDADRLLGESRVALPGTTVLAEAALGTGRPADAVELLADLVADLTGERLGRDPEAFRALSTYATALERSARLTEAVQVWELVREAAESAPERLPVLPAVMALVRCYRDSGDLDRAVDLGEAALRRAQELGLPRWDDDVAKTVSTLAGVYSQRGDHLRARVLLDDLVGQTDAHGSRDARGYALWNAAINAVETGRAGDGRRLADRAAALLSEGADARSQARVSVTRAWVLLHQDPPEATEARRLLRDALPALRAESGTVSVASAETELARCELVLGRPDVAQRHAASALRRLGRADEGAPLIGRARALTALGAALVAQGENAAGMLELERAAGELRALGAVREAAEVWRQVSALYRTAGAPELALEAAEMAMDGAGLVRQALLVPAAGAEAARPARTARRPADA